MKLYGIKNCDTVKKATKFLEKHEVGFEFVDLKTVELDTELIKSWLSDHPELINKRSTTYRQIKADILATEGDLDATAALVKANPTVIKRPVLITDETVLIGFDEAKYKTLVEKS